MHNRRTTLLDWAMASAALFVTSAWLGALGYLILMFTSWLFN